MINLNIYDNNMLKQRVHPLRLRYTNLSNSEQYREGKVMKKMFKNN